MIWVFKKLWFFTLFPRVRLIRHDRWLHEVSPLSARLFSKHVILLFPLFNWLFECDECDHFKCLVGKYSTPFCLCGVSMWGRKNRDKHSFLIYSVYLEWLPRSDSYIPTHKIFLLCCETKGLLPVCCYLTASCIVLVCTESRTWSLSFSYLCSTFEFYQIFLS